MISPSKFQNLEINTLLNRSLEDKMCFSGVNSIFAAATLIASNPCSKAQLLITPTPEMARDFALHFKAISLKTCFELLGFESSPYAGLYPSPEVISKRLHWLFKASQGKGVFVASASSLSQLTLPVNIFHQESFWLKKSESLPEKIESRLRGLGYQHGPKVEDRGSFSLRGSILDIFSPAYENPIRIELFADILENLKFFNSATQRSLSKISEALIVPAKEVIYSNQDRFEIIQRFKKNTLAEESDLLEIIKKLGKEQFFSNISYFLPYFYEKLSSPLDYFSGPINIWMLDDLHIKDRLKQDLDIKEKEYKESDKLTPSPKNFLSSKIDHGNSCVIHLSQINSQKFNPEVNFETSDLSFFSKKLINLESNLKKQFVKKQFDEWKSQNFKIFIFASTDPRRLRIKSFVEDLGFQTESCNDKLRLWTDWFSDQDQDPNLIHIINANTFESLKIAQEKLVFICDDDLLGTKSVPQKNHELFNKKTRALSFSDLNINDLVVHKTHGIGVYKGLKFMSVHSCDAELLQIEYKNKDKLYLPIYKIGEVQKYIGPHNSSLINKLGGSKWEKTKLAAKKRLRDIASQLVKLYGKRRYLKRKPFLKESADFSSFEKEFPFEETRDQRKAISDIISDMISEKPMDRLICGDVGFGKTEVALRSAFKCVETNRQVAIIAPTTVLTLQHYENFKKRFSKWPISIVCLNRFTASSEIKKNIQNIKSGKAQIIIGTHRLLSKDIKFCDLGLLIIDEEQKFGVKHKEVIRSQHTHVDTLALSATPIPRTLNMSLVGIRDLSFINQAPVERLSTRTFICRREVNLIKKAIEDEVHRGGQIFFVHNYVQSINSIAEEIKELCPTIKISVAHGQMKDQDLESTMVDFFKHKIDLLVCTSIIESGLDIPNANTLLVDKAHHFGLSQLHQLRGRVGRSHRRAYCYLLTPLNGNIDEPSLEKLKIIQENSKLGSGIQIAQYDLELRGTGNILGEDQSGHISTIGYEMYNELLEEAVRAEKGEPPKEKGVEPELNLRIPALIPSSYISDVKTRLSYYKMLSEISAPEDLDEIEEELKDRFGELPDPVLNLMGLMLIRKECQKLSVLELSSGKNIISLKFTDKTPLSSEKALDLVKNKKYSLAPGGKLIIQMKSISWPEVFDEVCHLNSFSLS